MDYIYAFAKEFLTLTWMVLPYFLGGAAFGAALDVFVKPEFALKHLGGGWLSMAKAAILGMVMPGCSRSAPGFAGSPAVRPAGSW